MTAETFTCIPARVADTPTNRRAAQDARLQVNFYRPAPGLLPAICHSCHCAVLVETMMLELGEQLTEGRDIQFWCDLCLKHNPPGSAGARIATLKGALADTPENRTFLAERRLDKLVKFAEREHGQVEVVCEAHGGAIYVPYIGLMRRGAIAEKVTQTRVLCVVCATTLEILSDRLKGKASGL